LGDLVNALKANDQAQIQSATTSVSDAIHSLGAARVSFDNAITQVNAQESYLQQETLNFKSHQFSLVGIDTATAATNLSQAQVQYNSVLGAAAKALPVTLLDYLK
jgi:flagellar hook-associated protein 3 FlgL